MAQTNPLSTWRPGIPIDWPHRFGERSLPRRNGRLNCGHVRHIPYLPDVAAVSGQFRVVIFLRQDIAVLVFSEQSSDRSAKADS